MTQPNHNKVIAEAARASLTPLGFYRKGRSRTWILDRQWHLILVEFQSSSWSKGTYLNVGANFLWYPKNYFSFDLVHRVDGWVELVTEDQFRVEAARLAERAAEETRKLAETLATFADAARAVTDQESGWGLFDRAILVALANDVPLASDLLTQVVAQFEADGRDWAQQAAGDAVQLHAALGDAARFTTLISNRIVAHREMLGLSQTANPLGTQQR